MAKYTIELRKLLENGVNIFDFVYPFYDENKRREFEEKFCRHFYFREIGCETVDRFKLYLADKMLTVFPYYNKLFEAAAIEYSVLDNYKLVEDYTITRTSNDKTSGISSSVGQQKGEQNTTSTGNKTTDTSGNASTTSTDKGNSKTTNQNNETTQTEETTNGTSLKNSDEGILKKFIDTPQGLTDIEDNKYLTTINKDIIRNETTTEDEQTKTGTTTSNGGGTSNTDTTNNATSETQSTGNETTTDNMNANVIDEQKTTSDTNIRTYSTGEQTEKFVHNKVGNIGVDTDSDMIEKHIRLQKTLTQIEMMFFNECEDLFMQVF